jgi:hypothetical protein
MKMPQLKPARRVRSPERLALAENIRRRDSLSQDLAANARAQDSLHETIRTARRAAAGSTALIADARVNAAAYLVAEAQGRATEPPLSIGDARSAARDAEETLVSAQEALGALVSAADDLAHSSRLVSMTTADRVSDVIRSELNVDELLAEIEAMAREWMDRTLALNALIDRGVERNDKQGHTRAFVAAGRLGGSPSIWGFPMTPEANPIFAAWRQAMAELEQDPDRPLPSSG